jgi:hypothetical protein
MTPQIVAIHAGVTALETLACTALFLAIQPLDNGN